MTVSICSFFQDYRHTVSQNTANDVWIHCRVFFRWWHENVTEDCQPTLTDVTIENLVRCRTWLSSRGRSNAYANKTVAYLRAMRNKGAEAGLCEYFAGKVKRLREGRHAPTAWTQSQMSELLDEATRIPGVYKQVSRADWWSAILWLAYNSGLRLDSMLQLRWSDCDFGARTMQVQHGVTKGKKGMVVTLKAETVESLERLQRQSQDQKIFGDYPYRSRQLFVTLRSLLRRCNLPCSERDLFHKLRRTFATHAFVASGDLVLVSELLQHSSLNVTRRYIDLTQTTRPTQSDLIPTPPSPSGTIRIVSA